MDYPTRPQLKNGAIRLSAAQEEAFDCYKLKDEEMDALCQETLFEDMKDPDILLEANSTEPTIQPTGNLQNEVKIEEESDVNGSYESTMNAADLLGDSDGSKEAEAKEDILVEDLDQQTTLERKNDERRLFTCPIEDCFVSYAKFALLDEHVKKSHLGKRNLSCEVCMNKFSSLEDVMAHIWMRDTKKCCGCGKTTRTKGSLLEHIRIHTRPFSCGHCTKRFATAKGLDQHEWRHLAMEQSSMGDHEEVDKDTDQFLTINDGIGRNRFICDVCMKNFASKRNLDWHRKLHTGERPFRCDLCDYSCIQSSSLKRHKRTCTGEKQEKPRTQEKEEKLYYVCGFCEKRLSSKTSLTRHEWTHAGKKPFECKDCWMRFSRSDHLTKHIGTHIREKLIHMRSGARSSF